MAQVTVNESTLDAIGNAIRGKLGVQTTYKPNQMPAAIQSIEVPSLQEKTIYANGTYVPSAGKNGFSRVIVEVEGEVLPSASGVSF
jgi:hypothetical protein